MYPSLETPVLHAFKFAYNFNSAVTFFILYNTVDVPLSANSVVTLLVNSRGWNFLRVVFSQTRNFTVIAFNGWIYSIEFFFTLALENRVCREIFHCIEYIFYHSGLLSNLRLPWHTEFALKIFTVLNILLHFKIFEKLALALKNKVCSEFTVLNIYVLSFSIFEQLALAMKNTSCPEMFYCIEIFFSFRIFEQLARALKAGFSLNSLYWIYIFIIQDFWATCFCPEKHELPWYFSLYWNVFIIQEFWATCDCPENILTWNFSRQVGDRPPDPPFVWITITTSSIKRSSPLSEKLFSILLLLLIGLLKKE